MAKVRVKMKTTYHNEKRCVYPGKLADFELEEAKQLVAGGFAEEVETLVEAKKEATEKTQKDVVELEEKKGKAKKGKFKKDK